MIGFLPMSYEVEPVLRECLCGSESYWTGETELGDPL